MNVHEGCCDPLSSELRDLVFFYGLIMATTSKAGSSHETEDKEKDNNGAFECNICFDTAKYAVISMCGHLYW